jgi:hypothetical protein
MRIKLIQGFKVLLVLYNQCALTHQRDANRAIAGMTRRLGANIQYSSFLEGLLIYAFDEFLLFYSSHTSLRRRKGFPIYSWSGWIGHLDFSPTDKPFTKKHALELPLDHGWLENCHWIIWYRATASGSKRLAPGRNCDRVISRRPFGFFCPNLPFPTYRTESSELGREVDARFKDYAVLQFWNLSTFFRLTDIDVLRGLASLGTRGGWSCGELFMDGYDEEAFFVDQTVFEVILLCTVNEGYNIHQAVCKSLLFFVMCIETRDGISERRGIGWLNSQALNDSLEPGLAWEEIDLA